MMTRRRFLVLAAGAVPVIAGIGIASQFLPEEKVASNEPAIAWGEDSCDHCKMIISDRPFAAAWIEPDGTQRRFDDVGCMVAMRRDSEPESSTKFFVQDYRSERWLDATSAVYMQADELRSPMAYNVAAFEAFADAEAELGEAATEMLTWSSLAYAMQGSH